jgi:hypothetical protein
MKQILLIFVAFITVPLTAKPQRAIHKNNYKQLPKIYGRRDSLVRFVTPGKNYTYWEFDDGEMDTTKNGTVLFSSGVKPAGVNFKDPQGNMFRGCLPSFCYKYIAYVYNGKVGYITSDAGFIDFMGEINSLPKAVILASLKDNVYADDDKRGGSYLETKNGYELILTRYIFCPMTKVAVHYTIDSKGIKNKADRGAFSKSKDCEVI